MNAPARRRVFAFANQKGGVGKTTAAVNIAAECAALGHSTLLVDCDPQRASATWLLGVDVDAHVTLGEVMMQPDEYELTDAMWETDWGFDFVPSDLQLAHKDRNRWMADEKTLAGKLARLPADKYGVVVLDCPPNLGVMTVNALAAADGVVIVTEAAALSLVGLRELLETIASVRQHFNERLAVQGTIVNKFDTTLESRTSVEELRDYFGEDGDEGLVWEPRLPYWTVARVANRLGGPMHAGDQLPRRHRMKAAELADMYRALAERMLQ